MESISTQIARPNSTLAGFRHKTIFSDLNTLCTGTCNFSIILSVFGCWFCQETKLRANCILLEILDFGSETIII